VGNSRVGNFSRTKPGGRPAGKGWKTTNGPFLLEPFGQIPFPIRVELFPKLAGQVQDSGLYHLRLPGKVILEPRGNGSGSYLGIPVGPIALTLVYQTGLIRPDKKAVFSQWAGRYSLIPETRTNYLDWRIKTRLTKCKKPKAILIAISSLSLSVVSGGYLRACFSTRAPSLMQFWTGIVVRNYSRNYFKPEGPLSLGSVSHFLTRKGLGKTSDCGHLSGNRFKFPRGVRGNN